MKSVEYRGQRANLGRFGSVSKGQVLEMFEDEWDGVREDPEFRLLSEEPSHEEKRIAKLVKPYGNPLFDLRSISWEKPSLSRSLVARFKRRRLLALVSGMHFVGAQLRHVDAGTQRPQIVDAIIESMRLMEWDKLTAEERWALPVLAEPPTYAEESELDAVDAGAETSLATSPRRRKRS